MTGNVNAVVLRNHRVHHQFDGRSVVSTAADGVIKMTKEAFDDAEKLGAVRRAKAEDRETEVVAVEATPAPTPDVADDAAAKGRRG